MSMPQAYDMVAGSRWRVISHFLQLGGGDLAASNLDELATEAANCGGLFYLSLLSFRFPQWGSL